MRGDAKGHGTKLSYPPLGTMSASHEPVFLGVGNSRSLDRRQKTVLALDREHGEVDVGVANRLVEAVAIKLRLHGERLGGRLH